MPSKRSKSKERERKRLQRANMTDDKKKEENEKKRKRMKSLRDERSLEEWKEDCKADNERKRKEAESLDSVEKEFRNIHSKHRKRSLRKQRTGKEKLQQNLKAKRGMRLLREQGRLQEYKKRTEPNQNEMDDWASFRKKGKKYSEKLEILKPDIVAKLNEEFRKEEERKREMEEKRKKQIDEDGGEWIYNPEYDDYHWEGEGAPIVHNDPEFEPLTAEELTDIRRKEEEMLQAEMENDRKLAKERRRQKQDQLKAAMKIPVPKLPEKEMCEYEKLRERNISERKKAMIEAGFFEDLNSYKQRIGMITTDIS